MAPIPLPRAPSISLPSAARSVSSSLARRSITPPTSLLSRALHTDTTIPLLHRAATIIKRQSTGIIAIPTTYNGLNAGPAAGTVAGIVIGAVGGSILLLYLLYTCFSLAGSGRFGRSEVVEEEVVRRRSRTPVRRRSRSHSEVAEVRRERTPERRRSERIVVEETVRRSSGPTRDEEDDIVEVIEEHSPVRRERRSKRDSGSGFRTVDPAEFGGGGRPIRKVRK